MNIEFLSTCREGDEDRWLRHFASYRGDVVTGSGYSGGEQKILAQKGLRYFKKIKVSVFKNIDEPGVATHATDGFAIFRDGRMFGGCSGSFGGLFLFLFLVLCQRR